MDSMNDTHVNQRIGPRTPMTQGYMQNTSYRGIEEQPDYFYRNGSQIMVTNDIHNSHNLLEFEEQEEQDFNDNLIDESNGDEDEEENQENF